jgi:lipopolysaccharide transport system permease protein
MTVREGLEIERLACVSAEADHQITDVPEPSYVIVVEPPSGWRALDPRELWEYRELLYFLVWRDVKVRYKQTFIGVGWAVLQPLLTMLAFSAIFGGVIGVPSDGVPYPLFSYVGLLPWTFFAAALSRSGSSIVSDARLVSKVYFPRIVLPIGAVLAVAVDFGVAFTILLGLMLVYGVVPSIAVVALPGFLLLGFMTALGVGLWLSALNVRYRDVAYVIPFLTQFWLFVTPVVYPSSILPQQWRVLYALNPMAGVVEGFRWALLGTPGLPPVLTMMSVGVVLALFASGLFYFHRTEDEFADVV